MAAVTETLLGVLHGPSSAAGAEALQALSAIGPNDAPTISQRLREEAQRDTNRALLALHILTLVQAQVAQQVLSHNDLLTFLIYRTEATKSACAMGHALASAASHAPLRSVLAKNAAVQEWLQHHMSEAQLASLDNVAQASADLVRIKLSIQSDTSKGALALSKDEAMRLFDSLRTHVVRTAQATDPGLFAFDPAAATRADAIEGLYYLVQLVVLRDILCNDAELLGVLVHLLQVKEAPTGMTYRSSLAYVIVSMLGTATAYATPHTEERRRLEALRRAASGAHAEAPVAPADAARRTRAVVRAGAVPPLVALSLRTSTSEKELRSALASLLLTMVTEQDTQQRGRLLQLGVGRGVLSLCKDVYGAWSVNVDAAQLAPLQALAKLSITTDPALLYRQDGSAAQGVQYLAALYFAPQSSFLQLFEATMALTNLASISPEMAGTVAHAKPPVAGTEHKDVDSSLVAQFLMHDDGMVRRALIELLCNLVQNDDVFSAWSGDAEANTATSAWNEADESSEPEPGASITLRLHTASGRLRLLVSLCRLEDPGVDANSLPMVLAAAGALATLTSSRAACARVLYPEADAVFASLLSPEYTLSLLDAHQLALRGMVIAANLVQQVRAQNQPQTTARLRHARLLEACHAYVAENAPRLAQSSGEPRLAGLRQQALTIGMDVLQEARSM